MIMFCFLSANCFLCVYFKKCCAFICAVPACLIILLLVDFSIQLDSDSDTEDHIEIQVSSEFQKEIDKFKRGFFCSTSNSLSIPSTSTALVLWKPPSGAVDELWRTLHKTTEETPSSNNPQNENGVTAHEVASRTINSALETNCWTNKTASNSNILCDDVFFHNNNNTDYVDLMEL
ncbi:unnamed protein product [Clavelina lepadiformis]|uniref:Uncharacterized protein n=1 Tax=Clavelina lepadiformis TaxID=159417 RepID=A0ABP0FBC3_CLALP